MNRPGLSINVGGKLMDFAVPRVMGIINVTPDSFFSGSRCNEDAHIARRAIEMLEEGADILDVGGCSTRPGSEAVAEDVEFERLAHALDAIREVAPDAVVSVDTFRSSIARQCVERWKVAIINDISGGDADPEMWETIAGLKVAYVLMHSRGESVSMMSRSDYEDVTAEVLTDLAKKLTSLRRLKVNDIILDPGFGFAKTPEQNMQLLDELEQFCRTGVPVLVGLSRKSMIWKTLGITPEESLAGTICLETIALDRGADILRVHDVKEAVEAVRLMCALKASRAQ